MTSALEKGQGGGERQRQKPTNDEGEERGERKVLTKNESGYPPLYPGPPPWFKTGSVAKKNQRKFH